MRDHTHVAASVHSLVHVAPAACLMRDRTKSAPRRQARYPPSAMQSGGGAGQLPAPSKRSRIGVSRQQIEQAIAAMPLPQLQSFTSQALAEVTSGAADFKQLQGGRAPHAARRAYAAHRHARRAQR